MRQMAFTKCTIFTQHPMSSVNLVCSLEGGNSAGSETVSKGVSLRNIFLQACCQNWNLFPDFSSYRPQLYSQMDSQMHSYINTDNTTRNSSSPLDKEETFKLKLPLHWRLKSQVARVRWRQYTSSWRPCSDLRLRQCLLATDASLNSRVPTLRYRCC